MVGKDDLLLPVAELFTPQFLGEQLAIGIQQKQELMHRSESAFIWAWSRLMGQDCTCVLQRQGWHWMGMEEDRTRTETRTNHTAYAAGIIPKPNPGDINPKQKFFTSGNNDIANDHTDRITHKNWFWRVSDNSQWYFMKMRSCFSFSDLIIFFESS